VRVESSLYAGLQVPLFYDPLLSKLIVWGKDRAHAIARMKRALDEYQIIGVRTTLPFARWLMEHPRYLAGDMSTDFIAEEWEPRKTTEPAGPPAETGIEGDNGALAPEDIASLVGGILLNQRIEEEKLRRVPAGENGAERSRWRDAARRDALRSM
jgi:acetyl/propionyl-CoA carboxylase alpha subunit